MPDQLQLFASDGQDLSAADLVGLLIGPGHAVRRAGTTRVSVLVDDVWRAETLVDEFNRRDLDGEFKISRDDSDLLVVRTAFTARLNDLLAPPRAGEEPVRLSGAALRLWVIAAGHWSDGGYLLPLSSSEPDRWARAGAALAARGVPGALIGPRAGGPAYRITSQKRLGRLRVLVGEQPPGAIESAWP